MWCVRVKGAALYACLCNLRRKCMAQICPQPAPQQTLHQQACPFMPHLLKHTRQVLHDEAQRVGGDALAGRLLQLFARRVLHLGKRGTWVEAWVSRGWCNPQLATHTAPTYTR